MRWIVALAALLWAGMASAQGLGAPRVPGDSPSPGTSYNAPYFGPSWGLAAFLAGQPLSLSITTTNYANPTDVTPFSSMVNGWTLDINYYGLLGIAPLLTNGSPGVCPAGNTSAGVCLDMGSFGGGLAATGVTPGSSPINIPVTRPNYTCSGTSCSPGAGIVETVWPTWPLRTVYPSGGASQTGTGQPIETNSGGNVTLTLALDNWVYSGDTVAAATIGAGVYTNGVATIAGSLTPTVGTVPVYQQPICAILSPAGLTVGPGGSMTVEVFCGAGQGRTDSSISTALGSGVPVAGVVATVYDTGRAHSLSKLATTMVQSTLVPTMACTGSTTGSNVLTGCPSTAGLQVGDRVTALGYGPEPIISALTATTLTFASSNSASGCTPLANGEESVTVAPPHGITFGDQAFAGMVVVDASLTGSSLGAGLGLITVPTGVASASSATTSTTMTIASASAGQFDVGEWIYYSGEPAGTNYYISALGTSTGGAGTVTIHCVTGAVCPAIPGGTAITGSVIGANPGGSSVSSIKISTDATGRSASTANACVIKSVYQGTTATTVQVTAGDPVPTYQFTFSDSDLSGASIAQGALAIRIRAYPNIGNVIIDSDVGYVAAVDAPTTRGCAWWYLNVNGGVCNTSSAALYPLNGQIIDPNFHTEWAYYDKDGSYAHLYVWVSGTTGATCVAHPDQCVFTAATDPGSLSYWASESAALAAIKACYINNALCINSTGVGGTPVTTTHNDINGVVFCKLSGNYSGLGGSLFSSGTAYKPRVTITSATAAVNCNANYLTNAGADYTVVQITQATQANTALPPFTNLYNITLGGTGQFILTGQDSSNLALTTSPTTSLTMGAVACIPGTNAQGNLYYFGTFEEYAPWVDETSKEGFCLANFGHRPNAPDVVMGGTLIGGTSSAGGTITNGLAMWADYGNVSFNLRSGLGQANELVGTSSDPQQYAPSYCYNKTMVVTSSFNNDGAQQAPLYGYLECNNLFEGVNVSSADEFNSAAAGGYVPANNRVFEYNTWMGGRFGYQYTDDAPAAPACLATGGSLTGVVGIQVVFTAAGGSTESSTLVPTYTPSCGASSRVTIVIPNWTDPGGSTFRKYSIYGCTGAACTPDHHMSLSGVDQTLITNTGQGITATVDNYGTVGSPSVSVGTNALTIVKTQFVQRFNLELSSGCKGDFYNSGTTPGPFFGGMECKYNVGAVGNVNYTGASIGSPVTSAGSFFDRQGWQNSQYTSASFTDISKVGFVDDRSIGNSSHGAPVSQGLNIGMGNGCPVNTASSFSYVRVPAGWASFPTAIDGKLRKNDGNGYGGAYEGTC